MSSSSSSESSRRKQTIACQQINVLHFCSTPLIEGNSRLNTLSVSTIDTNSSSSRKRQGKNQIELKRRILRKRISKHKKNLKHKKRDSQKEEKRRKKRETRNSFAEIDIDKDWETCNEYSPVRNTISGSDKSVLFKDLSPEKTREAPNFIQYHLNSPILQSRAIWKTDSPKRISFEEKERTWPLENLSFSKALHLNNDDEEEEDTFLNIITINGTCHLETKNIVKTYPGCSKRKRNNVSIEKCKQWLVKTSFPTVASNLLWDKFVNDNYDKISKYLTCPDNDEYNMSLRTHCKGRKNDNDENGNTKKQEKNFKSIKKLSKNMVIARGRWNKSLKKWDRDFESVYRFPNSSDNELEENDRTKRMSYKEFLQKCRTRKKIKKQFLLREKKQGKEIILQRSNSSSPTHQESIEKNSKSLISNTLDKQTERQRGLCQNVKSDTQKLKPTMSDIPNSELVRINTISSTVSLTSLSQNITSDQVISSLKRRNKQETDDKDKCEKQKFKKQKKPTIHLQQRLTGIKLIKYDKNWRIISHV
ncbi:uncharacterized protein LOC143424440 [Xylocopa sonorina]|uniref:uncharacterized protein LOC143424440 n=1 Tax=Xylocopa sonorina TaxID=1818115 RepID=UPI00403AD89D